ncbi:hypothetical protein L7F22_038598 [Adiantum nelumboides]|nr:hypothetical protein [Adiantum nelumboides]
MKGFAVAEETATQFSADWASPTVPLQQSNLNASSAAGLEHQHRNDSENNQQCKAFTRCQLNRIACTLPSKAHYGCPCSWLTSLTFTFNEEYVTNVVERALQARGAEMKEYNGFSDREVLDDPMLIGFLLHNNDRRWVALKKISGAWVNLDSYLDAPHTLGNDNAVMHFTNQRFLWFWSV